jgi:RNA polymerase sigma-70 factor (ECF subfamily)
MAVIEFDLLYENYKAMIWSLISRYVFNREDREDLFQEVFLNIHKALPKFRGEAKLETWLYRITINAAINHGKKQGRYKWLKKALSALKLVEDEEQAAAADIRELKPLAKLNPQQRMVLLLAEVEEKKQEEIAGIMGIPIGTVKSNLHRAKEIIKKEVKKNGGL